MIDSNIKANDCSCLNFEVSKQKYYFLAKQVLLNYFGGSATTRYSLEMMFFRLLVCLYDY